MACIAACIAPSFYGPTVTQQRPLHCGSAHSLRVPSERYEFMSHIQEGSTAHVYLARDKVTGQLVALKKVSHVSPADVAHWQTEIQTQKAVQNHPNIASAYEMQYDHMTRQCTLVMEYCEGGDLIDKVVPDVGMPALQAATYLAQVADGLRHMHTLGYAHRDIKSENVCLTDDGTPKLIDFGMAQHVSRPVTHRHAGTTPYLAYELLNTSVPTEELDLKAADVWSLGVMFYTMLTGRFAWRRASLESNDFCRFIFNKPSAKQQADWGRIPTELQTLLRGMLCINASERLTMDQVYYSLQQYLKSKGAARAA